MLLGPDVSSWQGANIDWQAVASSGRSFAWTKATQSTNYTNPALGHNWPGIRDAGLIRGAYHFGEPGNSDAGSQAGAFLAALSRFGGLQPGDLVALDLEAGDGDLLEWAIEFLGRVKAESGVTPMLYSGSWFLIPHGLSADPRLSQYPLWLSSYTAAAPPIPLAWPCMALWQYTDRSVIPGIGGPVDESYFFGSTDQLRSLGMASPTQASTPAPSVTDQVVTILSVIGDMTYPDGVNMDEQAPNQSVPRRIFQRQLVQHAKALLGA